MPFLQTPDQIISTCTHPIYVIVWDSSPKYSNQHGLPTSLETWLEANCPEVEIGQLVWLQQPESQALPDTFQAVARNESVLVLGFNDKQAKAFITAWSYPYSGLSKSSDFYHFRCTPRPVSAPARRWLLRARRLLAQPFRSASQSHTSPSR